MRRRDLLLAGSLPLFSAGNAPGQNGELWIRPQSGEEPLIWGRKDGAVFGLPSKGGLPGPRGLIRLGIYNAAKAEPELINFVAVEPVAQGYGTRQSRMGFSELEKSSQDGRQGKLMQAADARGTLDVVPARPDSIERLRVHISVEPFQVNGCRVGVTAEMISSRPQEVAFSVYELGGSMPVEELTLTATMGNYARLRHLWLKNKAIYSKDLYKGFAGDGFIDKENYPLAEMLTSGDGDAIVLATTDEENPDSVTIPEKPFWTYRSVKLTQYWRVPAWHIQPDIRVKVNGRRVYWASKIPIPGGVSFENFEVRQRYVPGQVFVFGMTPKRPWELKPSIAGLAAQPR